MAKLKLLQTPADSDVSVAAVDEHSSARPAWMQGLGVQCADHLELLADVDQLPTSTSEESNPLVVFFNEEIERGMQILSTVRQDLRDTADYIGGTAKPTNRITRLVQALRQGEFARGCEPL